MTTQAQQMNLVNSVGTSNRPPLLLVEEYDQWTKRLKQYLIGINLDVWRSVESGPFDAVPTQAPTGDDALNFLGGRGADGQFYTTFDLEKMENDRRAMREMTNAIPPKLFRYIDRCETAKQIFDKLATMFAEDETSLITKQMGCVAAFDMFRMQQGEDLQTAFGRFTDIVTDLHNSGYQKEDLEVNMKFVNNLGSEWRMVQTILKNDKSMAKMNIFKVFTILKTHESGIINDRITEEGTSHGPLALVSNSSFDQTDEEQEIEEYEEFMNSLSLYSGPNKRFHKFIRKPNTPVGSSNSQYRSSTQYSKPSFTPPQTNFRPVRPSTPNTSSNPSNQDSKESPRSRDPRDPIICNKCGEKNHIERFCFSNDGKPRDSKWYANVARMMAEEETSNGPIEKKNDQSLLVRTQGKVQYWSDGDESDEEEEPSIVIGGRGLISKDEECYMAFEKGVVSPTTSTNDEVPSNRNESGPASTSKPVVPSYAHMRTTPNGDISIVEQVKRFFETLKIPKNVSSPLISSITDKLSTVLISYTRAQEECHRSQVEQSEIKRRLNDAILLREKIKTGMIIENEKMVETMRANDRLMLENLSLKNDLLVMKRKFDTIYNVKLYFTKL